MTSPFRRRRLVDRSLAVGLAVVVAVVGLLVYRASDIRNANLVTGPSAAAPATPSVLPTRLTQKWSAPTDPDLGAVVSASGVVVTSDQHTITARDAVTGTMRWSYTRSNRNLCAVGSSDVGPTDMSSSSSVPGITAVYDENGFCSQVATFDPVTGARGKVRTSPNEENGSLVFGGPYAGWLGPNRLEVWRYDLVRTIQYGVQINPPKPEPSRTPCIFTDLALAGSQFATVEHCPGESRTAQVVLNFDDPGSVTDRPDGWDVFQHTARRTIDTGAAAARIVGITADRVAVLVSGPTPAVDVYDAAGHRTSHTAVPIPSADIVAADSLVRPARVTPAVPGPNGVRYSLVGDHVLAISTSTAEVTPPSTSFSSSPTTTTTSSITNALNPPSKVSVADLRLEWTAAGALGLPGTIDSTVLLPTAKGLSTFDATTGPSDFSSSAVGTIPVARGGDAGRVDVTAVGGMIIEDRGSSVVALD